MLGLRRGRWYALALRDAGVVILQANNRYWPASRARRVNAREPYWVPWSLWITVEPAECRVSIAMPRAFGTSAAVGAASMDQPTTNRCVRAARARDPLVP
jgi:hypothetical protein